MPSAPRTNATPPGRRAAILDAAKRLFAEQGYDATSLTEVGAAAGVIPGHPGLLLRQQGRPLPTPCSIARSRRSGGGAGGPGPALASSQRAGGHPRRRRLRLLRLPRRPAQLHPSDRARGAERRGRPRAPSHLSAGQEALAAISAELGLDDARSGDAAQLLLSIIALCWFPLIHARTVAPAVGVELERRRATSSGASATSWASCCTGFAGLAPPRPPPSPRPEPMTDVLTPPAKPPRSRSPPSRKRARSPRRRAKRSGRRRASSASCSRARSGSTWSIPFPAMDPADVERARPFMERLERFLRRARGQRPDRPGGQDSRRR